MGENLRRDLQSAAARIEDGMTVGIGGSSQTRKPMALIREIIRLGRRDLTILTFLGGIDVELLLDHGCVSLIRAGYVGFDLIGLAPSHAKVPSDLVQIETEASLLLGLTAMTSQVGFLPARGSIRTDIPSARPDVRTVQDPYSLEHLIAWPSIEVDVALIHTPVADVDGNARISGAPFIDHLLSEAAQETIVTTERLVDRGHLEGPADIRGSRVTAVVEAPWGAHPTACYPIYRIDLPYLIDYTERHAERRKSGQDWLPFDDYVILEVEPNAKYLRMTE